MKPTPFLMAFAVTALTFAARAQSVLPGPPEENGVIPKTETFYVNTFETINNGNTESLGVAITSDGKMVIGWEDDASDDLDPGYLGAVWTVYDASGQPITPETSQTSTTTGGAITSRFLSYFREDGSAVVGGTSWGPKIKANPFGTGFGMGATSYALGLEVPEFADTQNNAFGDNAGDFPSVQLLDSAGQPIRILSGVSADYAERDGDIRIADWDYLANGNVVIVGESRQADDLFDVYNGAVSGTHAIYRVLDASGNEVKPASIVSELAEPNDAWHGVGVTANGFAVRFSLGGRATIRTFDNNGEATSANIDLGTLTTNEVFAGGGRGDGIGFHGNGLDAYVVVNKGDSGDGTNHVWIAVINADGSLRYTAPVTTDVAAENVDRVDAAIDPSGRVLVAFDNVSLFDDGFTSVRTVMARLFEPDGQPAGGTFYVSEKELPSTVLGVSRHPRVAMRDGLAAIVWESENSEFGPTRIVAGRLFSLFQPGTIESAGLTRIVPDTPIIVPEADALGNWEPYASVLGNSYFLVEGNTFAEGSLDTQRYVVMLQPVGGGEGTLLDGFYADDGTPFSGQINLSRQNGNPGRVAGDPRPGAMHYMVGGEASPHALPEFQSDDRFNPGFDRGFDGRYATVQAFAVDGQGNVTPASKAIDAINGRVTTGFAPGNQIGRFGGDIVGLDNGNFAVVVDDRSGVRDPGTVATAVILSPDGTVIKESFVVAPGEIWSNVAAFQGGFAARVGGIIYFFDNEGNLQGQVDQDVSGESFDRGRGDGTRLAGHINSPYVFLAGKVTTGPLVKVAVFDSRDQTAAGVGEVSEPAFAGDFDRVSLAVDALNRVTVAWVSQPQGYEFQQVAARVLAYDPESDSFTALTPSFLPFQNTATSGIRTLQMSVAMTTREILVAAKGEINLQNQPANGPDSPREVNFYTTFTHPQPQDDPTPPVGGGSGTSLAIARDGANVTITWQGNAMKLQSTTALPGGWTDVNTTGTSYTTPASGAAMFFRLTSQ